MKRATSEREKGNLGANTNTPKRRLQPILLSQKKTKRKA
jgi:hypothetical protein